jgi:hypothetical protein
VARPVDQVRLSCPETPQDRGVRTALLAASTGAGSAGGRLAVIPLGAGRSTPIAVGEERRAPVVTRLRADETGPAATVDAEGGLAPGAAGVQWSWADGRHVSGLAVSSCTAADDEWWFNGVDTSVGAESRLVLTNQAPATAVVDLELYGTDGPVEAVGARGIPVAAGSREVLDLSGFAPGAESVTVHVVATRGEVSAAVHTARRAAGGPAGAEWVPPSRPPGRAVVVDPGLGGRGDQRLAVTNPGESEALVAVRILDESGSYRPTDLTDLTVPPGTVVTTDISGITRGATAAVLLESEQPVTAATVSESPDRPRDFALSGVSAKLSGAALVPLLPGTDLELAFTSAAPAGGRVGVEVVDDTGAVVDTDEVAVPGRRTSLWRPPRERASYVVVTPADKGPVQAVAQYTGRRGVATLPVVSGDWRVLRPAVVPAP